MNRVLFWNISCIAICMLFFMYTQPSFATEYPDGTSDALKSLHQYKESIEAHSYETTLQMCEVAQLKNVFLHPESTVPIMHILWEGFIVPIDVIFGNKADYIEVDNLGFFAEASWFQSMYVEFLTRSDGFKKAMNECLSSDEERERFKTFLLSIDYIASVSGQVVLLVAPIFVIVKPFITLIGRTPLFKHIAKKWKIVPQKWSQLNRKTRVAIVSSSIVIVGGYLFSKYREKSQTEESLSKPVQGFLNQAHLGFLYRKILRPMSTAQVPNKKIIKMFQQRIYEIKQKSNITEQEELYLQVFSQLNIPITKSLDRVSSDTQKKSFELMNNDLWMFFRHQQIILSFYISKRTDMDGASVEKKVKDIISPGDAKLMEYDFQQLNNRKDALSVEEEQYLKDLESFFSILWAYFIMK